MLGSYFRSPVGSAATRAQRLQERGFAFLVPSCAPCQFFEDRPLGGTDGQHFG
jgi:hypothetical protein